MDDLISRQLVMKTLCERRCGNEPKGCPSGFCTESIAVDCIPSAERKKGRWIKRDKNLFPFGTCSECGYISVEADRANFCPNCGARMEEE